ncbi:MAG: P1 family peptidase [Kineosporiaceae bacterium]|nr:P1 family peptidase [Kineosporiaceae bacterium]
MSCISDVAGIRVGHAHRRGDGWLTGTTVVLAPPEGAVAGVEVRGGGPGTRETDLLDPRALVERVHAVVLTGGSAFGLAAADGVMAGLAARGIGYPVGPPGQVVPIVPAAVIFDLGRGGDFEARPDPSFGASALDAALAASGPCAQGAVGAGTGAVAGGFKGGVGTAAIVVDGGAGPVTVGALVVVNALGSCVDPASKSLYAAGFGVPGEFDDAPVGTADLPVAASLPIGSPPPGPVVPQATTIGVIATDATLTKAQCAKVAGIGHDGLARAVRPVHTLLDGDTLFTMATCAGPAPDLGGLQVLLEAAADCVTRAVGHAMLSATTVTTGAGSWPCLRDWAAG